MHVVLVGSQRGAKLDLCPEGATYRAWVRRAKTTTNATTEGSVAQESKPDQDVDKQTSAMDDCGKVLNQTNWKSSKFSNR